MRPGYPTDWPASASPPRTFTGADLVDHVRTQLYYAVTVALVALIALVGLVYGLSEFDARRKGIEGRGRLRLSAE